MSLFQNYTGDLIAAATRTAEQQKMFERCMGTMHLWYGNAHIHIWMMSVVPSYATRKYDERGWCKFEKRVGGIITPSHMALDLGLMEDDFDVYDKESGSSGRTPSPTAVRPRAASRSCPRSFTTRSARSSLASRATGV